MTPHEFVRKWRGNTNTERQTYVPFFQDLCALVDHPTPQELDPEGVRFKFEAGVAKVAGGQGFADVWFKDHFAIEFKGPDGNLTRAYEQLLQYRESLGNPPLLIVSDTQQIIIHTNFTNSVKQITTLTLENLETPAGLQTIRNLFNNVEAFRPNKTAAQVTEDAAAEFAKLADHLRRWQHSPHSIAHYLIRLLFILFAEDIDLLPRGLFSRMVEKGRHDPARFNRQLRRLFNAMAHGEDFGEASILWFNGGLFDDESLLLDLDAQGIAILYGVTGMDWGAIEPSILGTLFTRGLDPSKRAQLGAHYTSEADIRLIVEPVLMEPLRREWAQVQEKSRSLAARRDGAINRAARTRTQNELDDLIEGFSTRIQQTRVLDPACGSGNFLYVSLRLLLELEKEVIHFCGEVGVQSRFPMVDPRRLFGIEKDDYAHELAQATVWIGYLQWLHANGYGSGSEPILKALDNIHHMDAILAYDAAGTPVEPEWPEADVIVGNPPFLGDKKMWGELGAKYVQDLRALYADRITGQSDLVCYWFEKARATLEERGVNRVGLLATQAIRGGANRTVLDRIVLRNRIFWAQSDRNWILDGAAVHVSMVGYDRNSVGPVVLDGRSVERIHPDLTSAVDTTVARQLRDNANLAYIGTQKGGKFELSPEVAEMMLSDNSNADGRLNREVVKPYLNGMDVTQRPRGMWIIDFGTDMTEVDASKYLLPYGHILAHVKNERAKVRRKHHAEKWWIHEESRPGMRRALGGHSRFIVTPRVSKHRVFTWAEAGTLPDSATVAFALSDDYSLGVLHSTAHELWARATGTQLREVESGFRYSQTMTFETYPFPWPPGTEPSDDPRVQVIAAAAKALVEWRDGWLNPPGLSAAELKKRTLTNLYNQRPPELAALHAALDAAVFAAYGWSDGLSDEEILERLLALNLQRAAAQ